MCEKKEAYIENAVLTENAIGISYLLVKGASDHRNVGDDS